MTAFQNRHSSFGFVLPPGIDGGVSLKYEIRYESGDRDGFNFGEVVD